MTPDTCPAEEQGAGERDDSIDQPVTRRNSSPYRYATPAIPLQRGSHFVE